MHKYLLPLSLLLTFASCRSTEQESDNGGATETVPAAVKGEVSTTETVGETGRNHAYIKRFYQDKGRYYVTADYIQFLNGEAAIAAAKRKGDAELTVQNGDSVYSVFNDYYIVNDDPRQRTFPLSEQAVLTVWDRTADLHQKTITAEQLQAKSPELLAATPFIIETKQGVIISLTEQYIP
ncbi:hypothetical protein [Hymenobacter sp. BT730]|uniref:hypothetical protein n=1 Tax=Hymenobacter sp. BT730 TaxID=3063332 RepID=UPI0026E055C7|nr:hypothetical protein [Hymenobacter sp. BT730]